MAEWSIAAVLKTVVRATGPGVRIPLSPPKETPPRDSGDFCFHMTEPGSPERGHMKTKIKMSEANERCFF
jgi:hypothetical protein